MDHSFPISDDLWSPELSSAPAEAAWAGLWDLDDSVVAAEVHHSRLDLYGLAESDAIALIARGIDEELGLNAAQGTEDDFAFMEYDEELALILADL